MQVSCFLPGHANDQLPTGAQPRHYSSTQPWQALTKANHQMMAIVKRKAAIVLLQEGGLAK
jgi:hypothetical protein